jgi:hydroxymethylpyrimidine pyrophosphatase-like HAD family hydrolase
MTASIPRLRPRLLAVDVDGTILTSERLVSDVNVEAVAQVLDAWRI